MSGYPYANTRLAIYLRDRIDQLKGGKSQKQIADECGFVNANFLSLLKSGANKVPLDRVAALAKALDCDPAWMLLVALEQSHGEPAAAALLDIVGGPITANEREWIDTLRRASDRSDPPLTARRKRAIFAMFGDG